MTTEIEEQEDVCCEFCGNPLEVDRILMGYNICLDCEEIEEGEGIE